MEAKKECSISMNVEMMHMKSSEARSLYIDYQRSLKKRRAERKHLAEVEEKEARKRRIQIENEEDDLRAAYREMSFGNRVLCLPSAIQKAGFNDQGLPLIAVAKSDWEWSVYESDRAKMTFRPDRFSKKRIELATPLLGEGRRYKAARALVPPVPPRFRPENLGDYYTLFEAVWQPSPPTDPMLLRQISTTMFVVVAQWDLTQLERAVLEGRFA
jgi:hypothetical protein